MASRKQRMEPAAEVVIEDGVDDSVVGHVVPQNDEREHGAAEPAAAQEAERAPKPTTTADGEDGGDDGGEDEEEADNDEGKGIATTFLTNGWREVGSSGLTAAELETLTHGLPPAEHTLASLSTAESQGVQLEVLQFAWSAPSRPIPESSIAGILGKLNKADSRAMQLRVLEHAAAKLAGFAVLDAAVRPLFVPAPQFQHASKLVLRATARGLEPGAFAELLDGLMSELGCFLSAAQAKELVEAIAAPRDVQSTFWQVACCRVVDRWHVMEASHLAGACDYGWDSEYALKLAASCGRRPTQAALQSKVLAAVARGDSLSARSIRVAECAARIIAVNSGAGSSG